MKAPYLNRLPGKKSWGRRILALLYHSAAPDQPSIKSIDDLRRQLGEGATKETLISSMRKLLGTGFVVRDWSAWKQPVLTMKGSNAAWMTIHQDRAQQRASARRAQERQERRGRPGAGGSSSSSTADTAAAAGVAAAVAAAAAAAAAAARGPAQPWLDMLPEETLQETLLAAASGKAVALLACSSRSMRRRVAASARSSLPLLAGILADMTDDNQLISSTWLHAPTHLVPAELGPAGARAAELLRTEPLATNISPDLALHLLRTSREPAAEGGAAAGAAARDRAGVRWLLQRFKSHKFLARDEEAWGHIACAAVCEGDGGFLAEVLAEADALAGAVARAGQEELALCLQHRHWPDSSAAAALRAILPLLPPLQDLTRQIRYVDNVECACVLVEHAPQPAAAAADALLLGIYEGSQELVEAMLELPALQAVQAAHVGAVVFVPAGAELAGLADLVLARAPPEAKAEVLECALRMMQQVPLDELCTAFPWLSPTATTVGLQRVQRLLT